MIINVKILVFCEFFFEYGDVHVMDWTVEPQKMARGLKFGFRKWMDSTIHLVKTKVLISCVVTAQLICAFVFKYEKNRFSHDVAQISFLNCNA